MLSRRQFTLVKCGLRIYAATLLATLVAVDLIWSVPLIWRVLVNILMIITTPYPSDLLMTYCATSRRPGRRGRPLGARWRHLAFLPGRLGYTPTDMTRRAGPSRMSDKSLLKSSGQLWKLYASFVLSFLGLALVMLAVAAPGRYGVNASILLIVGGLVLGIGAFIWACLAIRCPSCGAKLFWIAVSRETPADWLSKLLGRTSCPACGRAAPAPKPEL